MGIVSGVLGWVTHVVAGSPVTYLVVFAAVLFDGLIPLVPSEATIITASIVAAKGGLSIELIVIAAALGAVAGDNVSYLLGRGLGQRAARRLFRGEAARRRLHFAARVIGRRTWLVAVGRFVPGGRTAATFAAGMLDVPWPRFLVMDGLGAVLWTLYAASLGYFGGDTFQHSLWRPMAVALGIGLLVAGAVEIGRRVARGRQRVRSGRWASRRSIGSARPSSRTPSPGGRRPTT